MTEEENGKQKVRLAETKAKLEAHFKEKNITSVMQCPDFPNCPIQEEYVKAVYASMSKDGGGGFEF